MERKTGLRLSAAVAMAAGALSIAAPALAVTENVGGGTWDHDIRLAVVSSDYYHGGKCHGSTAVGQNTVRSADTAAGKWSYASARQRPAGNKVYWRTTCA